MFRVPKDRVAELESKVKDLENQLEEQEREANNVIDQWQENCAVSDSKCSELEDELDAARKENEILRQSSGDHGVNTLNARSLEGEPEGSAQLAQRIEELETQLQEKEQVLLQLQDTLANDEDVVHQWEGMYYTHYGYRMRQDGKLTLFFAPPSRLQRSNS